jgi:Protein of unknown function (DUF1822)
MSNETGGFKFKPKPKPGEIWEIRRIPQIPHDIDITDYECLYSQIAQSFIRGESAQRYVMIVNESDNCQVVAVMLLSSEVNYSSNLNIVISQEISGLEQDLLAETWLVAEILVCNLIQPVGRRLSYQLYNYLMDMGEEYQDTVFNLENASVFHKQELDFTDIFYIPINIYRNYQKYLDSIKTTESLLNDVLLLEQETESIQNNPSLFNKKSRIILNNWLENIFDYGWNAITAKPQLAVATRSGNNHHTSYSEVYPEVDEIAAVIQKMSQATEEYQLRIFAKRLGEIAKNNTKNSHAIQALINLLQTTQDDETLWIAVESLWQIDPGNSAVGVRRVKLIDLGMQLAGEGVALAVALVPKLNQKFGVLLQVYPTGRETYLPPELQLSLLDESGKVLRIVKARLADVYIQLKFSGEIGERFSVRVSLGNAEMIEDFAI